MRVAVLIIRRRREQAARFVQGRTDRPVRRVEFGVDDAAFTAEPEPIGTIFAITLNREDRVNAIGLTQVKVILTMVRGHMDEARAAVGSDEVACEHWTRLGKETAEFVHWVADHGAFEATLY